MLYVFLEEILDAPKLYSKIELIEQNNQTEALSGGGVHLLSINADGTTPPAYQLVFGKSNVIDSLESAIDNAFVHLKKVKDSMLSSELPLVESVILSKKNFDNETERRLIELLVPSKSTSDSKLTYDTAFGVFLGYSIGLDKDKYSNPEFRQKLTEKMNLDIRENVDRIKKRIQADGMQNHSFYFYVLPFNEADAEKGTIMDSLLNGGVEA
jgi:hypothetical protein